MPGPLLKDITPDWAKPANASVFDAPGQGLLRKVVSALGLDDPQQVMALGIPLETGSATTALNVLAAKFPRLAGVIKAYHGSPHDFERFDMSKIGTGEGAQAYGHGLYFAENPQTAESYKNILGGREFDIGGRKIVSATSGASRAVDSQTRAENIAAGALDDAFNAQSTSPAQFAANRLRYQQRHYPEESAHIDEALNIIAKWQEAGGTQALQGKTYEVAIKAHPDQFLDWDKPLSQQPQSVQKLIGYDPAMRPTDAEQQAVFNLARKRGVNPATMPEYKALEARMDRASQLEREYSSGERIYQGMRDKFLFGSKGSGNSTVDASTALKQVGIPGIKYLDQGSRAAGEGSRNYVVFDDKTIEILRKYGILLPMAGAAGAEAKQ